MPERRRKSPVRPIPPRQWTLPLPNHGVDQIVPKDYEGACATLRAWGFDQFWENESVSPYTLKYRQNANPTTHRHGLWFHPAGVMVSLGSYRGAPDRPDEVSRLTVKAQIDLPTGTHAYWAGYENIHGSGSILCKLDATFALLRDEDTSGGSVGLAQWLRVAQQYGRFAPFETWSDELFGPYLGLEHLLPLRPAPELVGMDEKTLAKHLEGPMEEARQVLLARAPGALREWLDIQTGPRRVTSGTKNWSVVEQALNAFSQNMASAGIRWPDEAQRKTHTLWMEVANGLHDDSPSSWQADGMTPGGNTLPLVLLYSDQHAGNHDRLCRVLREADQASVHTWCTQPDSEGYTLPLRVLERALYRDRYLFRTIDSESLIRVMDLLMERVGPQVLAQSLVTARRSVLGVLVEQALLSEYEAQAARVAHVHFGDVVAWLDAHGLPWHQQAVWKDRVPQRGRSEPTGPTRQLEGEAVRMGLNPLLDPMTAVADAQVLALWDRHWLQADMPQATPRRRSGPRL